MYNKSFELKSSVPSASCFSRNAIFLFLVTVILFSACSHDQFDDEKAVKWPEQFKRKVLQAPKPIQRLADKIQIGNNIHGKYEMATLPDKSNPNTTFWIGNLTLRPNDSYQFVDSNSNLDRRSGQENNFFLRYPTGNFSLIYSQGLSNETLLEDLSDRAEVARILFIANNGKTKQAYTIISRRDMAMLEFDSNDSIEFEMLKSWESYWK